MSNRLRKRKWSPGITISKSVNIFRIGWAVIEKSLPEHDPNERVYAKPCRPEVTSDVISGEHVKTFEGYAVLKFEVASFSSFRDTKIISWRRRRRRRQRTSKIALSENVFAFRLKKYREQVTLFLLSPAASSIDQKTKRPTSSRCFHDRPERTM